VAGQASVTIEIVPVVGRQTYSITAANLNAPDYCVSNTETIEVKVFDIPALQVLATCTSGADGTVSVSGAIDNANFTGSDIGEIQFNIDNYVDYWTTEQIFYNIETGFHTVYARNSVTENWTDPCMEELTIEVKDETIQGDGLNICEDYNLQEGEGLFATSYCFTWLTDQHNFKPLEVCADNDDDEYLAAMLPDGVVLDKKDAYYSYYNDGTLYNYVTALTFKAPDGEFTVKDAAAKPDGTISLYEYPFDPRYPETRFIGMGTNIYPNGTHFENLDGEKIYVLVLNIEKGAPNTCMGSWTVAGKKLDVIDDIATVNWYLNEEDVDEIANGDLFNPVGYPGSGVPENPEPGVYTFWAGCGDVGECRQPVQLIINPYPQVNAVTDTICDGSSPDIRLSAVMASDPSTTIDPLIFDLNFRWEAQPNADISGATSSEGPIIDDVLTVNNDKFCAIQVYHVYADVGGCEGADYAVVSVLVLNSDTRPTPPDAEQYACISDVPVGADMTFDNGCFEVTGYVSDSDNGGAGCPDDPLIITRTWTFNDGCEIYSVSQTITVIDDVKPTFTVPDEAWVYSDENCSFDVSPYTNAEDVGDVTDEDDNCSTGLDATYTDVEELLCIGSSKITRTWSLFDDCGNETTQEQIIWVLDTIPPVVQTAPGTLDRTLSCTETVQLEQALLLYPTATDNCSDIANITMTLVSDITTSSVEGCPNNYTRVRTWIFTDDCDNESLPYTQTIEVVDLEPPVLAQPPSVEYCVVDIHYAVYDEQPEPDADIIAYYDTKYQPIYEPVPDVLKDRPDYYVFTSDNTDLDLDPATYFSDNCSDTEDLVLHWSITDALLVPYPDLAGNELTDITGMQVSEYLTTNNTEIVFKGAQTSDEVYTITYWLEDECGIPSETKTTQVIIKPRPQIIKMNE
jgi:hypothetical protein